MKSKLSQIVATLLICLILIVIEPNSILVIGQSKSNKPLKILIDASKDGGLWWFPQGQTFDANLKHQGKAFADSLRRDGAEVIELTRGEVITSEKLAGVDLVIRIPAFFSYTADETIAYQESVAAGTKLILIGGSNPNNDAVAETFGVRFAKRTHFASVQSWIQHPFTEEINECCEHPWSSIAEVPKDSVILAWLSRENQTPVLGYLPYGRGYVVFVGQTLFLRQPLGSFSKNLINSVGRYSIDEVKQIPLTGVIHGQETLGIAPLLIEPLNNFIFPQPGAGKWRFDWEDIPNAKNYEIVIMGPSASIPLVQTRISKSEYTLGSRNSEDKVEVKKGSYIAEHNLRGWSWKVRSQYNDGTWGPWSKERTFNIEPRSQ